MLVAKSDRLQHVFTGPEVGYRTRGEPQTTPGQDLKCPVCNVDVSYEKSTPDSLFDYFSHQDGSVDCFASDSVSNGHRIAVEVAVKVLYNRINQVTGEAVEIGVEKWVGTRPNFVISDIRVTSPLKIAVEVYYLVEDLGLSRRLDTLFNNSYQAYLIFHTGGHHDVDRVERYLQQVAPLRLGRFNPESLQLSLGDLFTAERVNLDRTNQETLPNYLF